MKNTHPRLAGKIPEGTPLSPKLSLLMGRCQLVKNEGIHVVVTTGGAEFRGVGRGRLYVEVIN